MRKALMSVALLCLAAISCLAQDAAALEKGQKFLDKVAKAWSSKLPQETLLGMYAGTSWVGSMRYSVQAGEGEVAFVVTGDTEFAFGDMQMTSKARGKLSANLCPTEAGNEDKGNVPSMTETKAVSVANGKWKAVTTKEGKSETREGDVTPGTTWGAMFLPIFATPDDEVIALNVPDEAANFMTVRKLAETETVDVGGESIECSIWEGTRGDDTTRWLFAADGRFIEMRGVGTSLRMRVISEAERGKDLPGGEVHPAAKAMVDLYCAIKRGDGDAVAGAFDFERMAQEMVAGYALMNDQEKTRAIADLKAGILSSLTSDELRDQLPEEKMISAALGAQMQVTAAADGTVSVVLGDGTWKLYEVTEGEAKGAWKIFAVQQ